MSNADGVNAGTVIRKVNQVINLDLSIPEHNDYFLGLYGGYDNLKNKLPLFCEAYEKTLKAHRKGIGLDYKTLLQTGAEATQGFVDGVDIEYVEFVFANNTLNVRGITSLVNTASFIDQHLEVRTSKGEPVGGVSTSTAGASKASIELKTNFNPRQFAANVLEVDYTSVWISSDTGLLNAQKSSEDHKEVYANNIVKNIILNNPIKKDNPDKTKVVACYGRQSLVKEKVDYVYQQSLVKVDGVVHQRLILEFGAAVEFYPNTSNFKSIDHQSFSLRLTSVRGMAKYSTADRMSEIAARFTRAASGSGFMFNLDSDWKDLVPAARLPIRDIVDIQMEVKFNLVDGQSGSITISSMASDQSLPSNVYKALPLNLLWGCLSKNTFVTMADGSQKQITKISVGDKVLSDFNHKVAVVTNIWHGTENSPLWCIETENKQRLICSAQHPIITKNGIKTADTLTGADLLVNKDGHSVVIVALYPVEEKEVYNLDLSPEGGTAPVNGMTMICNGLLVGDNAMQNDCIRIQEEEKQSNVHEEECKMKNTIFAERNIL